MVRKPTVILSSKKHLLDLSQAVDVVKRIRNGMRNRRHGHDGCENPSWSHVGCVKLSPEGYKGILLGFLTLGSRTELAQRMEREMMARRPDVVGVKCQQRGRMQARHQYCASRGTVQLLRRIKRATLAKGCRRRVVERRAGEERGSGGIARGGKGKRKKKRKTAKMQRFEAGERRAGRGWSLRPVAAVSARGGGGGGGGELDQRGGADATLECAATLNITFELRNRIMARGHRSCAVVFAPLWALITTPACVHKRRRARPSLCLRCADDAVLVLSVGCTRRRIQHEKHFWGCPTLPIPDSAHSLCRRSACINKSHRHLPIPCSGPIGGLAFRKCTLRAETVGHEQDRGPLSPSGLVPSGPP